MPTSTGYKNVTVAFDTRAAPFVSLKVWVTGSTIAARVSLFAYVMRPDPERVIPVRTRAEQDLLHPCGHPGTLRRS